MDINGIYDIFLRCGGRVATDSRTLKGGELFFALKGENFDGNEFALKALEAGAAYVVVDADSAVGKRFNGAGSVERGSGLEGTGSPEEGSVNSCVADRVIVVDNTLKALQALARMHRSRCFVNGRPLTVVALTGTNGKTTTKELIRAVLSAKYRVAATQGNLNNSIGVPLTLLGIREGTQIAVVEMGASHPGDIRELVSVALPNYGLVTNVAKGHLLGFGSLEGVMKAKGEMFDYLQRTADKAFLNMDRPLLRQMAAERPDLQTIPYGLDYEGAEVLPSGAESPFLKVRLSDGTVVETSLVGAYNADNVMTALAVGREFGVSEQEAVGAIASYVPSNSRSQIVRTGANLLILDCYNANPASMAAALENLSAMEHPRKAAFLGNMLELGAESVAEHIEVLRQLGKVKGLELTVLVGEEFRKALEEAGEAASKLLWFPTSAEALEYLKGNPLKGYCVLVKGSRGARMEKVVEGL